MGAASRAGRERLQGSSPLDVHLKPDSGRPRRSGPAPFPRGRGTAEQWIKEGKYALNWTRLSCQRFVANRVTVSVHSGVQPWELPSVSRRGRSVQVKLIKMGGRLVRHARRLIFQLSEVSVPRRLFQGVLDRIGRLSPAPS